MFSVSTKFYIKSDQDIVKVLYNYLHFYDHHDETKKENKINKKHSENADTSTSVTFDL